MASDEITSKHKVPVKASSPEDAKGDVQKTEFWVSLLAALGTVISALTGEKSPLGSGTTTIITVVGLALIAGAYAYLRTDMAATKPGIKTKAFWVGVGSIAASVAMALADATIPGVPPTVSKIASLISAALIAAGYTAFRYNAKVMAFKATSKRSTND